MQTIRPILSDDLWVVVCLRFDHRACPQEVSAFKDLIRSWSEVADSFDLTGSFDFMFEAALAGVEAYNLKLESVKVQISRLVARYEANFVSKRFVQLPRPAPDQAIWVPCQHGLKRIDCSVIEQVTAEGDYMRVHCGGESWMVHMTMRKMREKLKDAGFVAVHRSALVRSSFIDELVHERRRWIARLKDGSEQPVSKSHLVPLLNELRADSSMARRGPSNAACSDEKPASKRRLQGAE